MVEELTEFDVHVILCAFYARKLPVLGDRVQVLWARDREWFPGRVVGCRRNALLIAYEDGDRQWESERLHWAYVCGGRAAGEED